MLIEIFRGNAVVADRGFPRKGDVPLEDLMGTPPYLRVRAIAVEGFDFAGAAGVAGCRYSARAVADLSLISFFPKVLDGAPARGFGSAR